MKEGGGGRDILKIQWERGAKENKHWWQLLKQYSFTLQGQSPVASQKPLWAGAPLVPTLFIKTLDRHQRKCCGLLP